MRIKERMKMVQAMEFICRQINFEPAIDKWFMVGVADGDIPYGDFSAENVDDYCEDDTFSELMGTFLDCMSAARKRGGLYCDGVVSENREGK